MTDKRYKVESSEDVLLVDSRGKTVATIKLPNVACVPEVITYNEQAYIRRVDCRIYIACAFYIYGTKSQAMFTSNGKLAYPEKLGPNANPFGRKQYLKVKQKPKLETYDD